MSIIRYIDGKRVFIAGDPITNHNQLSNRDAYGAHTIGSIVNLPEELNRLKSDVNKAKSSSVEIGSSNATFKDSEGLSTVIYDLDTNTLTKRNGKISVRYNADNETIVKNSNNTLSSTALKTTEGDIISANYIVENISSLHAKAEEAKGGYLDATNFGTDTPNQEALTNYALTQIEAESELDIPDQTKIINTYDNHVWLLNNKPNTEPAVYRWSNIGIEYVSVATLDELGVVKGSEDAYKGSVDYNGYITINGLEDALDGLNTATQALATEDSRIAEELAEVKVSITHNEGDIDGLTDNMNNVNSALMDHESNTNNPHNVTRQQLNLENVDNVRQYSELNEPPYPVTSVNDQVGDVYLYIPTVNDGTLSINVNSNTVATFKANQSTNTSVDITVPTKISELSDDLSMVLTSNVKQVVEQNSEEPISSKAVVSYVDSLGYKSYATGIDNMREFALYNGDNGYYKEYTPDTNGHIWVECGVIQTLEAGNTLVQLPVSFKDTNYFVTVNIRAMGNYYVYAQPYSNNQVQARVSDSWGTPQPIQVSVEAKGFKM